MTVETCLREIRALLSVRTNWDKTGVAPIGWCPITAAGRVIYHPPVPPYMGLVASITLHLKVIWRLRASVPASHRSWWPECIVRYNADPTVSHADLLRWLDTAIGKPSASSADLMQLHEPQH